MIANSGPKNIAPTVLLQVLPSVVRIVGIAALLLSVATAFVPFHRVILIGGYSPQPVKWEGIADCLPLLDGTWPVPMVIVAAKRIACSAAILVIVAAAMFTRMRFRWVPLILLSAVTTGLAFRAVTQLGGLIHALGFSVLSGLGMLSGALGVLVIAWETVLARKDRSFHGETCPNQEL